MDLFSHQIYIESQRTKQDRQVASSLLRCWKVVGVPDFLQLDNELSFRGSNRHPRSPGLGASAVSDRDRERSGYRMS